MWMIGQQNGPAYADAADGDGKHSQSQLEMTGIKAQRF